MLRARLENLTRAGDPTAVAALERYLAALAESPNALSTLNWMSCSRSYDTLRELISGAIALTHEALDSVDRGPGTIYLRSALTAHGALPARHAQTAVLATFIERQLSRVPRGPDRLQLQRFATWKVLHELSRAERRGSTSPSALQVARPKISVAADLLGWLSQHNVALKDLRQEHLDYWLADGTG